MEADDGPVDELDVDPDRQDHWKSSEYDWTNPHPESVCQELLSKSQFIKSEIIGNPNESNLFQNNQIISAQNAWHIT